MTDNTNHEVLPPELDLPTTPAYQFAYVLATIHSTFLVGDMERVHSLLANLSTALSDPDVQDIYFSEDVSTYLSWAYPILFGEDDEEVVAPADEEEEFQVNPDMTEEEAEEFLAALWERLFGDDPDAFKAPELREQGEGDYVCGDPDCGCADQEEDREELLAETDEFVIVKIWK